MRSLSLLKNLAYDELCPSARRRRPNASGGELSRPAGRASGSTLADDAAKTAAAEDATLAHAAAGVALAGRGTVSNDKRRVHRRRPRWRPLLDRRALYRSAEAPCDRTTFLARNPNGEDGDDAHSASEVGPKDNPDVGSTGRRPRPGRQAGRCQQQPCGRRRRPTREKPRPPASSNRAGPLRTPRCRPRCRTSPRRSRSCAEQVALSIQYQCSPPNTIFILIGPSTRFLRPRRDMPGTWSSSKTKQENNHTASIPASRSQALEEKSTPGLF